MLILRYRSQDDVLPICGGNCGTVISRYLPSMLRVSWSTCVVSDSHGFDHQGTWLIIKFHEYCTELRCFRVSPTRYCPIFQLFAMFSLNKTRATHTLNATKNVFHVGWATLQKCKSCTGCGTKSVTRHNTVAFISWWWSVDFALVRPKFESGGSWLSCHALFSRN